MEGVKIENVSFLFWPLSICLGVNFLVNSTPPGHLNALSWADSQGPPGTCPQRMHMDVRMCSLLPAEFLLSSHLGESSACRGHHVTQLSPFLYPAPCLRPLMGGSWRRPGKTQCSRVERRRLSVSQRGSRKLPYVKKHSGSNTSPVVPSDFLYKTKSRIMLLQIARWHPQSSELLRATLLRAGPCSQLSWPTNMLMVVVIFPRTSQKLENSSST